MQFFGKRMKMMSSFLFSLLLTSPFSALMANNSPKQDHYLKKKWNEKYSFSDGTILKLISGLACIGFLSIGGKKLIDRNGKKIINQSGNESIGIKKQNLEEYLPINIPLPKWADESCAIDSVLTLGFEIIEMIINTLDEKAMENLGEDTELISLLVSAYELLKDSKKTGEKAKINNVKCKYLKKYSSIGIGLRQFIINLEVKRVNEYLEKKPDSKIKPDLLVWRKGNTIFFDLFCNILPKELEALENKIKKKDPQYKLKKFEVEWEDEYCLLSIENCDNHKFLFLNYYPSANLNQGFPAEELNVIGKNFSLHGMLIIGNGHFRNMMAVPYEYLPEESRKEGKRFIERDGIFSKNSKCLVKNLISYDYLKTTWREHKIHLNPTKATCVSKYFYPPLLLYKRTSK